MTQRRGLSDSDRARLTSARARRDEAVQEFRDLIFELGETIGTVAICREAGISTSVYYDWKRKHGEGQ